MGKTDVDTCTTPAGIHGAAEHQQQGCRSPSLPSSVTVTTINGKVEAPSMSTASFIATAASTSTSSGSPGRSGHKTTRDIQRDEEKASRTQQVKERLGPIVSRLKASLSKMESLEASMDRLGDLSSSEKESGDHSHSASLLRSTNSEQLIRSTLLRSGKSREIMHGSMELVKRKLLRLKRMEEMLAASEERRHNLQHQVLQVSLSKPHLELAAAKRQNGLLQQQVEESKATTKESDAVEALQQELSHLEHSLKQATGERDKLKGDLMDRQAKINEQALQCDDLECQVEHMKIVCDKMLTTLQQEEDRTACLEQELMETRKLLARKDRRAPVLHPRMIHFQDCKDVSSATTELTVSTATESTCRGDDNSYDSSFTMSSASIVPYAPTTSEQRCDTRKSNRITDATTTTSASDDHHKSMIETLMATIEVMDRENAELREEKHHFVGKCKAQEHEMAIQAQLIRELEQRLGTSETMGEKAMRANDDDEAATAVQVGNAMMRDGGRDGQGDKGSFLQRFLVGSNVGREMSASNNPKQ